MTDHAELMRAFQDELLRQQKQAEQAREAIEAAEELYAPAALGPAQAPASAPSSRRGPSFRDAKFDRWVTYPVWVLCNLVIFGSLTLLTLGAMLFGTAVLLVAGAALDAVTGVPLGRIGAAGVSVLACAGSVAHLFGAFRKRIATCPW